MGVDGELSCAGLPLFLLFLQEIISGRQDSTAEILGF
jgi:hypothetical protein